MAMWDPNPVNPYGAEVARVIQGELGLRVIRFCRRDDACGGETMEVLPPALSGQQRVRQSIKFVFGLSRFVAWVLTHQAIVIAPWVTSRVECEYLSALQFLNVPVVPVAHNPMPSRDETTRIPRLTNLRQSASAVVTHSARFTDYLESSGCRVFVAPHPSYAGLVKRVSEQRQGIARAIIRPDMPYACLIGMARADKGFDLIPAIAGELDRSGVRLVVASSGLSEAQLALIKRLPNAILYGDGKRALSDFELCSLLDGSVGLLAPYTEVSASGTMYLANTLGAPVVAFNSEGARDLVGETYLVPSGDVEALAERVSAVAAGAYSWPKSPREHDRECALGWARVLDSIEGGG